ncbi:MAG: hypothetical protein BWY31_03312 [Lentisphaerae bacterium ADurb.Bin242]|nr:MAG: hypothetical protein BWY31_03312 [Lentisphaerae bacterium ADurb.Bin242]
MKKIVLPILFLTASFLFAGEGKKDNAGLENLVPEKMRRIASFNRNGRSVTVKVVPGKSYLISAAAKLNASSTNPDMKLRFVILEKGKKGQKLFAWRSLTAESYTTLSDIYKAPEKVEEITVVFKPNFTVGESANYKDFLIAEVSEELDE